MNPTQISPNTGRKFSVGSKYWLNEQTGQVMPREVSPYQQPAGYVAVIASSAEQLDYDNGDLDPMPRSIDPTDPSAVGAAVSFDARVKLTDKPVERRSPVTLPNAQDDHITRERSLAAFAASGIGHTEPSGDVMTSSTPPNVEPANSDAPVPAVTSQRRAAQTGG